MEVEGDGGDEAMLPFTDSEEEEKEREKAKIEDHLKVSFCFQVLKNLKSWVREEIVSMLL